MGLKIQTKGKKAALSNKRKKSLLFFRSLVASFKKSLLFFPFVVLLSRSRFFWNPLNLSLTIPFLILLISFFISFPLPIRF